MVSYVSPPPREAVELDPRVLGIEIARLDARHVKLVVWQGVGLESGARLGARVRVRERANERARERGNDRARERARKRVREGWRGLERVRERVTLVAARS